ncbi:outer membrane beta-barrel protein [Winogradskyella sp.]|uniref:outer membrane beta-barrel protein n=1 Tax=Winogradskyella sp. TaxID=1883156 RepID=UPI003F6C645F
MKSSVLFSVLFSIFIITNSSAQEEEDKAFEKYNISITTGIGYGKVENENQPNYDLNANIGELLFTYNLKENLGIATGVGYLQLSGNGFNTNGNFYHERDLIKIPLLLRANKNFGDKFNIYALIGFYGQTIVNEEFRYLNSLEKDVFGGWSFGLQSSFTFEYEISEDWSMGINIATQSDFNKLDTKNDASFEDEQAITTLNTIGLLFKFRF